MQIRKPYCLDVEGGSMKNGAPLILYPCHSGPNQQFSYNRKTRQIKTKMSKKCLDIKKGRVVQNTCNSKRKSQKWRRTKKHYVSVSNKGIRL